MKREYNKITRGTDTTHRVTIVDDIAEPGSKVWRRYAFVLSLVQDGPYSGLLNCGPVPYETMQVFHDGSQWVAVFEATEHHEQ